MAGVRRSDVAVEAERRLKERRARVGGQIKGMRTRRGWTKTELAERCDVGRMVVMRAEKGDESVTLETLERMALAFGVPLNVGFTRDGLDVADGGHLAIQEIVLRAGRSTGLAGLPELPTRPNEPWRSIDVVLGSRSRALAVCVECWNTFGDVGAAIRSSRRKAVELSELGVAQWGADARARLVWVVRDSAANRALVARYPEVFIRAFPGSSRQWVAALTAGSEPPNEPGLVWCDTRPGRLHAWYRPGRGPAPTGSGS